MHVFLIYNSRVEEELKAATCRVAGFVSRGIDLLCRTTNVVRCCGVVGVKKKCAKLQEKEMESN